MTYALAITPSPQVTVTITPAAGADITVTPVSEGTATVFPAPQPVILTAITGVILSSG